jgi:dienelactone hydrolase
MNLLKNSQNRILIVFGDKDPLIPAATKKTIEKKSPHVNLKVFQNCSHTPMLEKPEFNELLLSFFHHEVPNPAAPRQSLQVSRGPPPLRDPSRAESGRR